MSKEHVRRFYDVNLHTREQDGSGIISGQPIVYNNRADLGYFDEVIDSGALDTADLNDVRLCLNHDTSYVYARSRRNNGNSTMKLSVNESGLSIEADLAINDSPKARDYYSAVKRGDIDKMSFMFTIDDEEWENLESSHPLRRIKKIGSVFEVSAVTFPAYDSTSIYARSKESLENDRSALERARQQSVKSVDTDLEKEKLALIKKGGH